MELTKVSVWPHISNDNQVTSMLQRDYGLTAISIKQLNGYDDRNYHVVVETEHTNTYVESVCPRGYLVKIINAFDSKSTDFSLGQKLIMDQLNSCGIHCQKEIKTSKGEYFSSLTVHKDGEPITYMVSVRTFLPGVILEEAALTPTLAYDVGALTAEICKSLQNFKFQFHENFTPLWNMDKFSKVKSVLHAVTEEDHSQVAKEVFQAFESEVIPMKKDFRKGTIHGDINEQNILVEKTSSGVEICGLLDFQDSVVSYCIYDFAIAIAYMMMLSKLEVPLLDVGGHMLAGYEKVIKLNDAERQSLRTLIASRMVMSLVYGAYYYSLDPSNEYFLATSKAGWNNLLEFWNTDKHELWKNWDEIIQTYINH